jgi:hypothetical protein
MRYCSSWCFFAKHAYHALHADVEREGALTIGEKTSNMADLQGSIQPLFCGFLVVVCLVVATMSSDWQ